MSSEGKYQLLTNLWAKEDGANSAPRPRCHCLDPQYGDGKWSELKLHTEQQDTECAAWARLLELVDEAAKDGREEFSPGREMLPQQWAQITTLPTSIVRLKSCRHLILYGSSMVRIPPEIGEMTNLEQFSPYTSYRLHWFPYEIVRCKKLRKSTVSTRALYGNYKHRPPFPRLPQFGAFTPTRCSICDSTLGAIVLNYWITLRVATDNLPLLVHACSENCLSKIPTPGEEYVQHPHEGGLGLVQPRVR